MNSTKKKNSLPSGIKCCIKKCKKSKRNFKGLKLFKFPDADMTLGQIWREKCQIPEKDYEKKLYICERHFSGSYVGKKYLKSGAIPTIDLDELEDEADNIDLEMQNSPKNMCCDDVVVPFCANCEKQIKLSNLYRKKYNNLLKKF